MIAQSYYTNDIKLPLDELIRIYNSACPSMNNYGKVSHIPYLLTSTILMEILLKRIHFKIKGRFRGTHNLSTLIGSLKQFGFDIREFSEEELDFISKDHSAIRYTLELYSDLNLNESVIDGLFNYFISFAVELGIE